MASDRCIPPLYPAIRIARRKAKPRCPKGRLISSCLLKPAPNSLDQESSARQGQGLFRERPPPPHPQPLLGSLDSHRKNHDHDLNHGSDLRPKPEKTKDGNSGIESFCVGNAARPQKNSSLRVRNSHSSVKQFLSLRLPRFIHLDERPPGAFNTFAIQVHTIREVCPSSVRLPAMACIVRSTPPRRKRALTHPTG